MTIALVTLAGWVVTAGTTATAASYDGPVAAVGGAPAPTATSALVASPASGILPAGTSSVRLTITSPQAAACRIGGSPDLSFAQMRPFGSGDGTTTHRTPVAVDATAGALTRAAVRCSDHPDQALSLMWRDLPSAQPGWPRRGNLWGWEGFAVGVPDAELARVDLWLGADLSAADATRVRRLNPAARILTSYNAVEWADGLPADYYLTDVSGHRIEVWPGAFRLNLTRPQVADFLARQAYHLLLDTDLRYDGIFIDNVFTTQSWADHDIRGRAFHADADHDGVADDPAALDRAWRTGVIRELTRLRGYLPDALLVNHSLDYRDVALARLFDGTSIGFDVPYVKEQRQQGGSVATYPQLEARYDAWSTARHPVTMVESAVPTMLGYGYGFLPWQQIPASTLDFARTFYPFMRFGFGVTLMRDGYFTHELGDTWHGNRWWYDEELTDLGTPTGAARRVLPPPDATELLTDGDAEAGLGPWTSYAAPPAAATLSAPVASGAPAGAHALRVDVTTPGPHAWDVELDQGGLSLVKGRSYAVSFWVRSDRARTVRVSVSKGAPDWRPYGLDDSVPATTRWARRTVSFTATETVTDARLQLLSGDQTGWWEVDGASMTAAAPDVLRRDFTKGVVVLNATDHEVSVPVGAGLSRMTGRQAPADQRIVDDPAFAGAGAWSRTTALDSGEWKDVGPYFHSWGGEALLGTGSGSWALDVPSADAYDVDVWWPAAPSSGSWSASARYEVVSRGSVVASATFDQRRGGDTWHRLGHVRLAPGAMVRLTCTGPAPCVADGVSLASARRYNDGSPVRLLTLAPYDAAVLVRR